jgi:hypothetical protein
MKRKGRSSAGVTSFPRVIRIEKPFSESWGRGDGKAAKVARVKDSMALLEGLMHA